MKFEDTNGFEVWMHFGLLGKTQALCEVDPDAVRLVDFFLEYGNGTPVVFKSLVGLQELAESEVSFELHDESELDDDKISWGYIIRPHIGEVTGQHISESEVAALLKLESSTRARAR